MNANNKLLNSIWIENIEKNIRLVQNNLGPAVFIFVAGSEADKIYWHQHFENLKGELFCQNKNTKVISVAEKQKKGNFLGTLNAWIQTKDYLKNEKIELPDVALMSMIFGQGKRLSPFTQALGNRKSAFPLPFNADNTDSFFCTADLSCLYSNLWISYLRNQGFRGIVVKWGDEAVIPGKELFDIDIPMPNINGIRFVSYRPLTPDLAREKEWLLVNKSNGLVAQQFARSNYELLTEKFTYYPKENFQIGVNLGSLAISYDFLDAAIDIFYDDINDSSKWIDWDPYVWIALHCETEAQWIGLINDEKRKGFENLNLLIDRFPNLYRKVFLLKQRLEKSEINSFSIQAVDFGQPYWADFGLHHSLQNQFEALLQDSDDGVVSRKLFKIPESVDNNGNRIIRSKIPEDAKIYNSLIIDSVITNPGTYINRGIVAGGIHDFVNMPDGGSALYCVAENIHFHGARGVALFAIGRNVSVTKGGRHTTLLTLSRYRHLVGNESITDYGEHVYNNKIFDNEVSFADAERIMSEIDSREILNLRERVMKNGWVVLEGFET